MIHGKTLDTISETDFHELRDLGIPEGLRLEYKRDLYGSTPDEHREFLKDVTAFANRDGGDLIIGISENGGVPDDVQGVPLPDPDTETQRLQNLINTGIEPRIFGIRVRAVPLSNTRFFIIVRVPKSWSLPHRVSLRGHNKFYLRNSSGVHQASVEELRVLFTASAHAHERSQQFQAERLKGIQSGQTPTKLTGQGALIVHIFPISSVENLSQIDLLRVHSDPRFRPMWDPDGVSPQINFDGVLVYTRADPGRGYTQVYRNGTVEAVQTGLVKDGYTEGSSTVPIVRGGVIDDQIRATFRYIEALHAHGVQPPYVVNVAFLDLSGVYLGISARVHERSEHAIDRNPLLLPPIIVTEPGSRTSIEAQMLPAYDALWNATGRVFCPWFARADGAYTGPS